MQRIHFTDDFFFPDFANSRDHYRGEALEALQSIVNGTCQGSAMIGWYDWPKKNGFRLVKEVEDFSNRLDVHYDTVVVVGIGGSYLGTKAAVDCLGHSFSLALPSGNGARRPVVFAGQNLSEAGIIELMDFLDTRQPLINVISKTGMTTEPSVAFRILQNYIGNRYGATGLKTRIIATTDPISGALRSAAETNGWQTFPVPADVGGRYSVLTAVGIVPLALAGFNIQELMEGADEFFQTLRQSSTALESHPVIRYAAARKYAWDQGKRIDVLAFGEAKMSSFVEWWKQLFGESEGKNGLGMLPVGLSCTTDLHSLGQYVQDGCRNIFETFLTVEDYSIKNQQGIDRRVRVPASAGEGDGSDFLSGHYLGEINSAAMTATKIAHFDGSVPSVELAVPCMDERHLGYLFAFFETACGVSAAMLGVNPYDQPGVEEYKQNLFALMGKPGMEDLGSRLRARIRK
jgi:glucose-6-phosphate isomerase